LLYNKWPDCAHNAAEEATVKSSKRLIPTIGLVFALVLLYFEGGVWRILAFVATGLGVFAGLAFRLFERAEGTSKRR